MGKVLFKKLNLNGFGLYRQGVSVELTPALNLLLAPNESGKSTLAHGLAAVVFGLPTNNDAKNLGTARFRNWEDGGSFEGEVWFSSQGADYHLRRRFEDHNIVLRRLDTSSGRWVEEMRGTHNPQARRGNSKYVEFLRQHFGMENAALFRQTFFLEQPLPTHDQLDVAVQQLLSGGSSNYKGVLNKLLDDLKVITRHWDRYSAHQKRGGNKDRELEDIMALRAELAQELATRGTGADELQSVLLRLSSLEEEHQQQKAEYERKRGILNAFERWQGYRERYTGLQRRQRERKEALERAKHLQGEITQLQQAIAAGADATQREKAAELAQVEQELRELANIGALGESPATVVESVRNWLAERIKLYQQWLDLRERQQEISRCLERYTVMEQLDAPSLGLVKSFSAYRRQADRELTQAQAERKAAEAQLAQSKAQQELFRTRFGTDISDLPANTPDLLQHRLEVEEHLSRAAAKPRQAASARPKPSYVPAILGLLLGMAGAVFLQDSLGPLAFLLPIVLGGLCLLASLSASKQQKPATTASDESYTSQLTAELEAIKAKLPQLAHLSVAGVADARAAWLQCKREELHAQEALRKAENLQQEARRAADALVDQLQPVLAAFEDPEEAYAEWQQERNRLAQYQDRIERLHQQIGEPEGTATTLNGALDKLKDVLALVDISPDSNRLLAQAAELEDAAWHTLLQSARRYSQLQAAKTRLVQEIKDMQSKLQSDLRERTAALEQILTTYQTTSLAELTDTAQEAESDALLCRREWQELVERNPGLPLLSEARQALAVEERLTQVQAAVAKAESKWRSTEEQLLELRKRQSELEGRALPNIAATQETLLMLKQEEAALRQQAHALGIALDELELAAQEFQSTYRQRLAATATEHFHQITGQDREVVLDESFAVTVLNKAGQLISAAQLSQGAQDQLYLALRLAIGDLLAGDMELPFIFDDPFLTSDESRIDRIGQTLQQLGRQILLLSHNDRFAGWGNLVQRNM